ncbi:transcriptional regulator [Lacticaseibacillus paracasei]|uniref:XRE family transcriptional regulator n=1 Tax=Lacticaseibacillus paracasei NRIC 0644 TaxID=1435038 RepID=A0A0C9PNC0_LACPA|nr:transcriptional regulator [Lacticaseibacillus paracasei]GAN36446.1 hypothetical protein LC0644_1035 [Lacticaseibacillus paracasei NRIC 0644]GAN39213.1 hypothetical protein LC1917_1090 [Lacticaseibacillus paracasei NRIC 1917]
MTVYSAVKTIAQAQGRSIYRIEKDLNFVPGKLNKWDKSMPGADVLQDVANYLGVTSAYILDKAKERAK